MEKVNKHFELLILKALLDKKGRHVALLLRAMGAERNNWDTNRKAVGVASTWLISFDAEGEYRYMSVVQATDEVVKYIHMAGFTSEELIAPLELLL
jgi:hypothetical protein